MAALGLGLALGLGPGAWPDGAQRCRAAPTASAQSDPPEPEPAPDLWMDLFEWLLCKLYELLGGDCSDLEIASQPELQMNLLAEKYWSLSQGFQPTDPAGAREWIEELHGLVTEHASEFVPGAADSFCSTLECMYADAGGDPGDL